MEETFFKSIYNRDPLETKEILRNNPTINVNWKNMLVLGRTALHIAARLDLDQTVAILLAHPGIDVNVKDEEDETPFMCACYLGRTSCARLLLKDSRVDVNQPSQDGSCPLYWAARHGNVQVIKYWIASGREMDLGEPGNENTDAIAVAKKPLIWVWETDSGFEERIIRCAQVATLLEKFVGNPMETRYEVRVELGCRHELAAEVYALVVFVSDGLLGILETGANPARFFAITSKLPLELQIVLCCRVVGSSTDFISGEQAEVSFRELGKSLQGRPIHN